jgi:hypothetical protein
MILTLVATFTVSICSIIMLIAARHRTSPQRLVAHSHRSDAKRTGVKLGVTAMYVPERAITELERTASSLGVPLDHVLVALIRSYEELGEDLKASLTWGFLVERNAS